MQNADKSASQAAEFYRAGLTLWRRKQDRDAFKAFREAYNLNPDEPRYGSYYGLCLAKVGRDTRQGLRLCESAAEEEFYRPEVHLNLGRVLMILGQPRKAQEALREGLSLDPQNREIIRELQSMGVRKRPLFPFLDRKNPLNKYPGMVIHRLNPKSGSTVAA